MFSKIITFIIIGFISKYYQTSEMANESITHITYKFIKYQQYKKYALDH